MIGMPLAYSIADGLALGLVSYPIVKLLSSKGREVSWLMYLLVPLVIVYFVLVRAAV